MASRRSAGGAFASATVTAARPNTAASFLPVSACSIEVPARRRPLPSARSAWYNSFELEINVFASSSPAVIDEFTAHIDRIDRDPAIIGAVVDGTILVARSDPVDQYVVQHPELLTQGWAERAAIEDGHLRGVRLQTGAEIRADHVVLALGHSARDTFAMLHARGVSFEKCFDELNLTNPAAVAEVHREYIEAG